jgi:hypothetical protein
VCQDEGHPWSLPSRKRFLAFRVASPSALPARFMVLILVPVTARSQAVSRGSTAEGCGSNGRSPRY